MCVVHLTELHVVASGLSVLPSWSGVLLKELLVPGLLSKFPTFCRTQRSATVLTGT
jgi:hypothetical protein